MIDDALAATSDFVATTMAALDQRYRDHATNRHYERTYRGVHIFNFDYFELTIVIVRHDHDPSGDYLVISVYNDGRAPYPGIGLQTTRTPARLGQAVNDATSILMRRWADLLTSPDGTAVCAKTTDGRHRPRSGPDDPDLPPTHLPVACAECGITTGVPIPPLGQIDWG